MDNITYVHHRDWTLELRDDPFGLRYQTGHDLIPAQLPELVPVFVSFERKPKFKEERERKDMEPCPVYGASVSV